MKMSPAGAQTNFKLSPSCDLKLSKPAQFSNADTSTKPS